MTRPAGDAGSVSILLLVLFPGLLAVTGLVYDGSRALTARQKALNHAEQAARDGAGALSETDLRAGHLHPDPKAARAAALDYLSRTGEAATIDVRADEVTVRVRTTYQTTLLRLAGLDRIPVAGTATARVVRTTGQEARGFSNTEASPGANRSAGDG